MTTAEAQRSLRHMIREVIAGGVYEPREVARRLMDEPGIEDLLEPYIESFLTQFVRHVNIEMRGQALRGAAGSDNGNGRVPASRLAYAGDDVWDAVWPDVDKPTHALTIDDLNLIIAARRQHVTDELATIAQLEAWRDLAKKKRVRVLGDLRTKGVPLPEAA